MKHAVLVLLTVVGLIGGSGLVQTWASSYSLPGIVVSSTESTATIADSRGCYWDIYTNRKVMMGTRITIFFHDNYTPNDIHDDIVKDIKIEMEEW